MVMMQKLDLSLFDLLNNYLEARRLNQNLPWFGTFNRLDTGKQVTRGIMYVHSQGFIHLDLKPQNILLQSFKAAIWIYKIIDWDHEVYVPGGVKPPNAGGNWISTPGFGEPGRSTYSSRIHYQPGHARG